MTKSPWPAVEAYRNRILKKHDTGRVFGYFQCQACDRWFGHERPENAPEPRECPVCDEVLAAKRKAVAKKAISSR